MKEKGRETGDGIGGWEAGEGSGRGKRGMGNAKRESVSGDALSFLESTQCIRLLGALKATPASPVLACFAREQP